MASQKFNYYFGIFINLYCLFLDEAKSDVRLFVPPSGVIYSPKYPKPYDNNTNCMWHITSTKPDATIVLSVEDLDIEPDAIETCPMLMRTNQPIHQRPCCRHNWLSVPVAGRGKTKSQQLCGNDLPVKPILVRAAEVTIKLHTSKVSRPGRGFRLAYTIVTEECSTPGMVRCGPHADSGCYNNQTQRCNGRVDCALGQDEADCATLCQLHCDNGIGCYGHIHKCDGYPDCQDFSDEMNCGLCEPGKVLCSKGNHYCFHPHTERCDGKFDCPWGEDEVGCVPDCKGKIACSNGEGCYSPAQRCDTLSDCLDSSDETQCAQELCNMLSDLRLCSNGHCLPAALWCDGTDDCGDGSDEAACIKNSMIALALIGCLLSGLLLVIGVGCACRVYSQRYTGSNYNLALSPHLASRLRMSTSVSLPTLVDDEYFHREPPPAYSVAVGANEVSLAPPTRPHRSRRLRPRPVVPPQVAVKPAECVEASSSQSSPSRGSLSSSGLSATDDTLLLSS